MESLRRILSEEIFSALGSVNYLKLYEIRIRADKPMVVNYDNNMYYFSENGLCQNRESAKIYSQSEIENIIMRATNNSIYAFTNEINKGFICLENGIRLGVVGNCVYEKGVLKNIKDITSINIRIPHLLYGISNEILPYIIKENTLYNTLIIGAPSSGKTTLLRDIPYSLSKSNYPFSILLVDERGEMLIDKEKNCLGDFTDIIQNSSKKFAFEVGVRSMSPDIIITDEIYSFEDFNSIYEVANCGVKVIASIHANSIEELKKKKDFSFVLENKIFERYILLNGNYKKGQIQKIYDSNFKEIR